MLQHSVRNDTKLIKAMEGLLDLPPLGVFIRGEAVWMTIVIGPWGVGCGRANRNRGYAGPNRFNAMKFTATQTHTG